MTRWTLLCATVALLAASCGRVWVTDMPLTELDDASDDEAHQRIELPGWADGAVPSEAPTQVDAGPPQGCPAWQGDWTLTDPEPLVSINTRDQEIEPYLSGDGLTLYFSRYRPVDPMVYGHVHSASRSHIGTTSFSRESLVTFANSAAEETRFSITPDDLIAFISTTRAPSQGAMDIWMASRASPLDAFSAFAPVDAINSAYMEFDPAPSPDGLRLYFARNDGVTSRLLMAERPSRSAPYASPRPIPGFEDGSVFDDNPTLSPDERLIIFGSRRASSPAGTVDLWYSIRPDRRSRFTDLRLLPIVNTESNEYEAHLRGCELFFSSDRPGGAGGLDIYRTVFLPL